MLSLTHRPPASNVIYITSYLFDNECGYIWVRKLERGHERGKSYKKVERMTENRRLEKRKGNTKSEVTREINQKSMYKNAIIKSFALYVIKINKFKVYGMA